MSGWLKKLRRRLQNKKPALLLAGVILIFIMGTGISTLTNWIKMNQEEVIPDEAQQTLAPQDVEIVFQKVYLAGPMDEQRVVLPYEDLDRMKQEYKDWNLVAEAPGTVVYQKVVDDLSPVLKENGYFGITSDGVLSVFEGDPDKEKVIQTFFQLDLERIESILPKEELAMLRNGIRFTTLTEFNSILSTYGEYASE